MDKKQNIFLGKIGENIACEYLKSKKYKIILRNFRKPFGEIDVIAFKNKTLFFIEVKTLKENKYGLLPEDQMTNFKIKKLKKVAEYFLLNNPNLINKQYNWQIDLITIIINNKNKYLIKHYENI